tara:strand:- start:1678 stop:1989 length:312 start_codon:yes stop_codon:yes gene_type:complete
MDTLLSQFQSLSERLTDSLGRATEKAGVTDSGVVPEPVIDLPELGLETILQVDGRDVYYLNESAAYAKNGLKYSISVLIGSEQLEKLCEVVDAICVTYDINDD